MTRPEISDQAEDALEVDFDPTAEADLAEIDDDVSLAEIVHSLSRLLPDNQDLTWVEADMAVADALVVLQRTGFSQAPVRQGTRCVGVFSYRSFARMATTAGNTGPLADRTVADCIEKIHFASVEERIEDIFDNLDKFDAVLVGSRDDTRGLVTGMDALRYLFELANGYVLMRQIELGLRHAILICVDDDRGWLAESIGRVLAKKYEGSKRPTPQRLRDMEMTDLISLITSGPTCKRFVRVFGPNTLGVKGWLSPLPEIRNDLFHFKQSLSVDDYERLATTRDWLLNRIGMAEGLSLVEEAE